MSAIACVAHFDGRPVAPGVVQAITATMRHRGLDGIAHWQRQCVALGHCMRHTTPESLREIQPLPNEDGSVCLVLDGRVDNRDELRHKLLGAGARLRDDTDAELVLRAYEVWGEACPDQVIGEWAFLLWDGRQNKVFAARDAAGSKPLYYAVLDQGLAVSTQVKGLLVLPGFKAKLNESRFLDFWVNEFDRIDEIGTVYQGIVRLPAGHAMRADAQGVRTWRYWDPSRLPEARFASLDDCAEAFRAQLRQAVQCRLRSIKPMSASLSGGLDSSTLVGMISKDFRDHLRQPLRTYSLVDEDRAHCLDSQCIESIVRADPWLQSSVITSARAHEMWRWLDRGIEESDDIFGAAHNWVYSAIRQDAHQDGCGHMFEGMAGDLLFYSRPASINGMMWDSQWTDLPAYLWRLQRFGWPVSKDTLSALISRAGGALPGAVLAQLRRIKDMRSLNQGDLGYLRHDVAQVLASQRRATVREQEALLRGASSMERHAARYKSGSLSFSYEVGANARVGPDGRSPYSDRRMMEFAVSMPLQAKMVNPWYKQLLRKVASHYLPADVVWRKQVGYHPGWRFHAHLFDKLVEHKSKAQFLKDHVEPLSAWVQPERIMQAWQGVKDKAGHANGWPVYSAYVASTWLKSKGL